MALFQYSPLEGDEIRLLILSSRSSGPLRISIKTEKLSSSHRPRYEALSYAWGSKENPCKIPVEDTRKHDGLQRRPNESRARCGPSHGIGSCRVFKQSMSAPTLPPGIHPLRSAVFIPATANLAHALPYLQLETEERVLWIDAISINQGDIAERGQQVERMADIFKMATQLVIWLGPADCDTKLATETLARFAAEVEVNFVTEEVSQARNAGPMSFLSSHEANGGSLLSLFQRPWFQRLWIWQEAQAHADETIVLIGEYSIPWSVIQKFLMSLYLRPHDLTAEQASVLDRARALSRVLVAVDLVTMLLVTHDSQCADARDRLGIKPDYTKTVADVFQQVVLQFLSVFNKLDVLNYCKLVPEVLGMPSWVPRWSKRAAYSIVKTRASLSANAVAEYDGESMLRVLAVEVGTVASLQLPGYFAKDDTDLRPWADFVSRIFSLFSASERAAGLSSSIELIMRTLTWNHFADRYDPPPPDMLSSSIVKDSLLRWGEYLASKTLHADSCEPPPVPSHSLVFRRRVQQIAAEYSPFRTTKGQIGLGPKVATSVDKICVILGSHTPLVLRLVSESQWCIVGDCYVHDIMDGGALRSSLPGDFQYIERMNPRNGRRYMAFKNTQTGHIQIEDPRITEPLPAGWELVRHNDEEYAQLFDNEEQSQYTWADPRLNPDALRAGGVKLKNFNLV